MIERTLLYAFGATVRSGSACQDVVAHVFDMIVRVTGVVVQAYRFALAPTPAQEAQLRSHCGGQRFAFNWGLARVRANLDQRAAEKSYDIPADQLTPPVSWSAYDLREDWNQVKDEVASWWAENSKESYASGLANLARALKNWDDSRKGKRRGRAVGFPRFKGRRAGVSCRYSTGPLGLAEDRRHVKLPRIGLVRTHESTRKLARHVERGTARVRSATVSQRAGRWFCSFSVEIARHDPVPARSDTAVGVDLGVTSLAVLSTGEVIANPRHLEVAQRELRRLQRQAARRAGPDRRSGRRASRRWRRTRARIATLHTRVANARRDGLHKLTTRLVRTFGAVVIEDLHVAGMLGNRRLARRIAGVGMGELRRQVEYKAGWAGVHVADRWYPSSKTCSGCGVVKAKLRLSERTFTCDSCGFTLDRDLNAARNLVGLVEASSPSCGVTVNEPDGNPGKTSAALATGTATGRPTPHGAGQRRCRKATAA
jgi:putative transposase